MTCRIVFYNARVVTPSRVLEPGSVWVEDGRMVRIDQTLPNATDDWEKIDTHGDLLVPAFVDLHIHGMGGFGPEQATPEALLQLSSVLAQQGVAVCCPTLYCAQPARMAALLRKLTPALGKETGAKLLGFHLEGPFISPQKPGVMKPQDIAPVSLHDFQQIYEAAEGKIALVTLAPELAGIDTIIEFCLAHHILIQAGHTNATYEQMQQAFEKGVRRITHFGNAMSGLHQRAPGVFGAALLNPDISCEVIADGKHVHPAVLQLLHRLKPISKVTAVTDALLPTGQPSGPFIANGEEVVLVDGVWKRKSDGVTAGSALTMLNAFKQLLQNGYNFVEAAACTSTNAAQLLDFPRGRIQAGLPADFVLLSDSYALKQVWLNGQKIA